MEGNAETVAERLQIAGVRFIMDILHSYMQGLDGETWHMDLGTTSEELGEQQ